MTSRLPRAMVVAVLTICALLVSPLPLGGVGLVPVLALVALDVALIRVTGGLAFARRASLDERLASVRDLAYRRGFRLLGLGVVLALVGSAIGTYITFVAETASQVDGGIGGRLLVALAELVVIMPTLVLAWSRATRQPGPIGLRWALAVPAVAAAWLLYVGWTPAQTAPASRSFSADSSATDSTCQHFVAGRVVGAGLGATVGLRAEVCWNGRQAFVIGDPGLPLPDGVAADPNNRFLTACDADDAEDFAAVTGKTCTASIDGDGTLRYAVRARVSPLRLPVGARDVAMDLVVTRDGKVLSRP